MEDLDDFFNDVEEVAAAVEKEGRKEEKETQDQDASDNRPPAKKQKQNDAVPPPIRPKGVVVAAAASSTTTTTATNNSTASMQNGTTPQERAAPIPPPPPPPPPPALHPQHRPPNQRQSTTQSSTTSAEETKKKPKNVRTAAGKTWVDPSLDEWPENDFRIFVGNLDKTTTDQQLHDHFATKYPSIAKAKVVTEKGIGKGYGFVSFLQPLECARALREMDQTWLGTRPMRIKKSDWQDRNMSTVHKKNKQQHKRQRGRR